MTALPESHLDPIRCRGDVRWRIRAIRYGRGELDEPPFPLRLLEGKDPRAFLLDFGMRWLEADWRRYRAAQAEVSRQNAAGDCQVSAALTKQRIPCHGV